ncbi:GNAT family N-acetyltransferase [Halobacillus rhizosphaerae]|uniref:GNAT family N-acetyltransferase n=1 Tax=Halobacillus rhizosphaerae TaxID=3064889 RepID=UPI00398AB495
MKQVLRVDMDPVVKQLLGYAASEHNVDSECNKYKNSPHRKLFGLEKQGIAIGCMGVELNRLMECEIKHIAVSPDYRNQGAGRQMVSFLYSWPFIQLITAETDRTAVQFYRKLGFTMESLGEKYPGVERFKCTKLLK